MDVTNVNNSFYSDSMFPEKAAPKTKSSTPTQAEQIAVYKREVAEEGQIARILSQREMQDLVNDLNDKMTRISTDLRFGFNDTVEMMEISVINVQTDKVIRKFPTEDAVKLMSSMKEFLGILFDEKG